MAGETIESFVQPYHVFSPLISHLTNLSHAVIRDEQQYPNCMGAK
jgi:hypothetical protein